MTDLKPENIFVIPDAAAPLGERVKLLDFGIAKFLEGPTRKTTIGTILGTPLYMSPEQCEGSQDLDAKVDVYALGVLLYEMLTGHLPFMADTTAAIMRQHIFKAPPPLAVQAPRVPAEIAGLVHRMLAKPPTERPAMTAVHAALDRFLSRAADMQSGPRQALALQLAAHRQPGVVVGGAAADPMASTIGGAGSGEPARAEPAADLAGAVGPGPWPDAVNPGPGPGAAGDSALPPSPPARADSAEQSAAPRPVSSRPEPAQESRRRALLAGALLILVLALTLAVVSRRPGGSAQAPVYPSAPAAPPSAAALSAAPVSNAAPAPVAPGRAESEAVSPSTGHETAAAGPPVVRSPEPPSNLPKAAKAVKPHPGGKRPHGSAPDRDAPKNREEDPERAWR